MEYYIGIPVFFFFASSVDYILSLESLSSKES